MNPMSDSGVVVDAQGFVGAQGSNGFTWIAKEPVAPNPKFDLIGEQMQILNVGLGPGETMMTEPGSPRPGVATLEIPHARAPTSARASQA